MSLSLVRQALQSKAKHERALSSQRFFKTALGEYAHGDIFIGVSVPELRQLALAAYKDFSLQESQILLSSAIHEERLLAILILIQLFEKKIFPQQDIFDLLIAQIHDINNWDLVDTLAPKIIGAYLWKRDKSLLYEFAKSDSVWQRRIAILSTFYFIRQKDAKEVLRLATLLLTDPHDLIQKAVGWMLREMGRHVGTEVLLSFLESKAHLMPRTMLSYATEKLDKATIKRLRQK